MRAGRAGEEPAALPGACPSAAALPAHAACPLYVRVPVRPRQPAHARLLAHVRGGFLSPLLAAGHTHPHYPASHTQGWHVGGQGRGHCTLRWHVVLGQRSAPAAVLWG